MEDLREQLRAAEEARDRLRNNMQLLKTKIIDTGNLVQLYQQTQAALKKEQEEVVALRAQLSATRTQLKVTTDETSPLKDKYEQALVSLEAMKHSLDKKDTQLNSQKSLIDQLRADVADGQAARKDKERMLKDAARLKKDIVQRDVVIKEVREKNAALMTEVDGLKGALVAALAERTKHKENEKRMRERELEEERVEKRQEAEVRDIAKRRGEEAAIEEDKEKEKETTPKKKKEKKPAEKQPEDAPTTPAEPPKNAARKGGEPIKRKPSQTEIEHEAPKTPPSDAAALDAPPVVWPSQEDDFGDHHRARELAVYSSRAAALAAAASMQREKRTKTDSKRTKETSVTLKATSTRPPRAVKRTSSTSSSAPSQEQDEENHIVEPSIPEPALSVTDLQPLMLRLVSGPDDAAITSLASAPPLQLSAAALSLLPKSTDSTQLSKLFNSALTAVDERKRGAFFPPLAAAIYSAIFDSLRTTYSAADAAELSEKSLLCSAYALACRTLHDGCMRMRVFFFDMMRLTTSFPSLLLAAAEAWPLPMQMSSDSTLSSPILAAIRAVVYDQERTDALASLCKACEWPLPDQEASDSPLRNLDQLGRVLFTDLLNSATSESYLPARAYQSLKALELVSVQLGWSWAYEKVIQELSWPRITGKTQPQLLIALFRLVGIIARIGNEEAGGSEQNAVPMLRTHLLRWLTAGEAPAGVRAAVAEALLEMGAQKEHVAPVVQWFGQLSPSVAAGVPQTLVDRLRALIGEV